MKYLTIRLTGNYGHFKKPETDNNPLTYAVMHKPAVVGLIGAVLGIERVPMRELFPKLCDAFKIALVLNNPVIKESHGFTSHKAVKENFFGKGRVYREYLRKPDYTITLALADPSQESILTSFRDRVKARESVFPTNFGNVNCPAYVSYVAEGDLGPEQEGPFTTQGLVSSQHTVLTTGNIGADKIPTHQTSNWYNPRDRFISVIYSNACKSLEVSGPHNTKDNGESLWFY